MTEREALKLALEALVNTDSEPSSKSWKREIEALTAIKQVLAQPEQEPVGWYDSISGGMDFTFYKPHRKPSSPSAEWIPVYSRPPQRKPLTDEMTKQMRDRCDSYEMRGAFVDGWLSAEAAHGIKE